MSKRYLDDVLSSDAETSGSDSFSENLNIDDYRIDINGNVDRDAHVEGTGQSTQNHGPPYNLESVFGQPDDDDNLVGNDGDLTPDVTEDHENSFVPDIVTPPRERKRVRFGANEKDDDDDLDKVNPWDFKRLIRKLYKEQLPDTYQIRNWKRPPRDLLTTFIELIENNVQLVSDDIFEQYQQDLDRFFPDNDTQRELKDKVETNVFDITYNIKKKLKRAKVPSKIWVDNLHMEYVYAKGEYIKKRYEAELDRTEAIERQLLREEERMKTLQETEESNLKKHKELLTNDLTDLSKKLHPSLSVALSNTFGLIKDAKMSNDIYQRDQIDFNLRLKTDFSKPLMSKEEQKSIDETTVTLKSSRELADDIFNKFTDLLPQNI
ncbi:unnamed protein product [Kluyveromyces dobzhanskii CBS 2104]|uniref:WGS project CCBQ000000000 data, contig 00010 n=1 Tax=Kluyveromyces dobzhanskii CBS 2104 TaxID=1427455 RepID=A0A0A8LD17_9SACH|nr:unnamed protein product [Kluyveromyces dobzhanskii CBS 2104]